MPVPVARSGRRPAGVHLPLAVPAVTIILCTVALALVLKLYCHTATANWHYYSSTVLPPLARQWPAPGRPVCQWPLAVAALPVSGPPAPPTVPHLNVCTATALALAGPRAKPVRGRVAAAS